MKLPHVVIVYPLPMPYTFPVFRLIADSGEVQLTVLFAKRSLAARGEEPKESALRFPHRFLADFGHVFVRRNVREVDLNPGLPLALERRSTDLVVLSGFVQPTSLIGIAWARVRRRPYGLLIESHDLRRRSSAKSMLRHLLVGPLVRGAAVLFPSGESAIRSLDELGARRARMMAFPHVPDPAIFGLEGRPAERIRLRESLGLSQETAVIAFVGRLVTSKGVESLLRAHSMIHDRTGAWLVIAGAGPLRQSLEASAPPGVSFVGFCSPGEVSAILRGADLAVSPSLDEPWGTFPLEAAASGCPIVASDRVASARELVGVHGAGRLVPAGAADELASAVISLLEDPAELEALGTRAALAAQSYTPERAARSFLDGVRMALDAKAAR
jgi:glycosyltransferase involved in cell wall biosynthesis